MESFINVKRKHDGLEGKAIFLDTPESLAIAAGDFQQKGWLAVPRMEGLEIATGHSAPTLLERGRWLVICGEGHPGGTVFWLENPDSPESDIEWAV